MSSAMSKRYHCFHCNEDLHYRVFCRHKEEYYDPLTNQWQSQRNDDEDSNDSIFTHEIDGQNDTSSNDYSEINVLDQTDQGSSYVPNTNQPSSDEFLPATSQKGIDVIRLFED